MRGNAHISDFIIYAKFMHPDQQGVYGKDTIVCNLRFMLHSADCTFDTVSAHLFPN